MKCPRCDETLPHRLCERCGERVPEGSRFCCWCGNPTQARDETSDLLERVPCGDGRCIGILNESGVCNICGKSLSETL